MAYEKCCRFSGGSIKIILISQHIPLLNMRDNAEMIVQRNAGGGRAPCDRVAKIQRVQRRKQRQQGGQPDDAQAAEVDNG